MGTATPVLPLGAFTGWFRVSSLIYLRLHWGISKAVFPDWMQQNSTVLNIFHSYHPC